MFEKQIAKGVKYLDKDLGKSWPERIYLDALDLADGCRCIIGQCYRGHFSYRFNPDEGLPYGFEAPSGSGTYGVLTAEWKEKIKQLRSEREAKDAQQQP